MKVFDPQLNKQNASMMSANLDVLNASGIDGLDSHDELSVIEPMEIHDNLPVKSTMIDHDCLGAPHTHTFVQHHPWT